MTDSTYFYEPRLGHGLPHDPFNAIVGPRPIGWISSHSAAGALNLAPYSFFNAFNYTPPIVGFASIGYKDTVRNVEQTREFCWNLVTRELAEAMNQTCASVPPEVNEFDLAGLTPVASRLVAVPRVLQSSRLTRAMARCWAARPKASRRVTGPRPPGTTHWQGNADAHSGC